MTNEEAISMMELMMPLPRRGDGQSTTHLLQTLAIYMAIDALKERKTGKWIHQYKEVPNMATFKCSCCGCVDEFAAKYCSNCGAKMEGVDG